MQKRIFYQGSTLIVVLIVLLLVTIIGTISLRHSSTFLRLATNSQAQQLLTQNSDSALFALEDPKKIAIQLATNGVFGYFFASSHAQDELIFCYKNQFSGFLLTNASIIKSDNSSEGTNGYCKSNFFSTARGIVLSQVYVKKDYDNNTNTTFSNVAEGTSIGSVSSITKPLTISVMVVSILPAFSNLTNNSVETCFQKNSSQVEQCFRDSSVPYNIQYADYSVGSSITVATS